jgi:ubiquinone/menaquinone biosynthesis C-methylase UbiE
MRNYLKKGYWWKWLPAYFWQWIRPILGNKVTVNKIFDLNDIGRVRAEIMQLRKFNDKWFQRIFEPETKGVRAWEYGLLLYQLGKININNKKILDVGTGGSLMPDYLASLGAKVTTLDLQKQTEERTEKRSIKIRHVIGDMTKMKFANKSFDIIICISAVEHVESWDKTVKALKEMKRVLKSKGKIFLTTDFYLPRQKTDNWVGSVGKIEGAYKWKKLKEMSRILEAETDVDDQERQLLNDKNRANFRGRYFTTVFLAGTTA